MKQIAVGCLVGIGTTVVLAFVPAVLGQGRQQLGNSAQVDKAWRDLKQGKWYSEYTAKEKVDPAHVDAAAKFFVYRMTWDVTDGLADGLNTAITDLAKEVTLVQNVAREKIDNRDFQAAWAKALVKRFRELTDLPLLDNSRAILHGVQMFPTLAKLRHDDVGIYFVGLIDDQDFAVLVLLPHGHVKVSTALVYARFDETGGGLGWERRFAELGAAVAAVRRPLDLAALPRNDLASSPLCAELEVQGAFRADVSGAGPAVYGLFAGREEAATAARALKHRGRAWVTLAVGDLSLDVIARAEAWLVVPGGAEGFAAGAPIDGYMLRE